MVEGKEDITIKISDEGGGIARSAMGMIWTYMYTTMKFGPEEGLDEGFRDSDFKAPMAGFGYGLPLSRLVCGFFISRRLLLSQSRFSVCPILRWRSAINFDGWVWNGCLHSSQPLEQ